MLNTLGKGWSPGKTFWLGLIGLYAANFTIITLVQSYFPAEEVFFEPSRSYLLATAASIIAFIGPVAALYALSVWNSTTHTGRGYRIAVAFVCFMLVANVLRLTLMALGALP